MNKTTKYADQARNNHKPIQSLRLIDITKAFGTVKANRNVNLELKSGEILGLLGENGAGKTTLMNILYGLYQPDAGEIQINGEKVELHSPRDAIHRGIGMVHQHFMLVQNHTVAENVALGYEGAPFFFPLHIVQDRISEFSERYGLRLDPDERIWRLSAGEQQRVEIVKALLRGADLLILDEPTSVLTTQETEELFTILRQMTGSGQSVIFISHKLEEVLSLCQRVAVLRKGEIVGSARTNKVSKRELARMMVGRDILFDTERKAVPRGELILDVQNLTVLGDRRETAVDSVSFQIFANEILGIAGVAGNGQRELIEAITGLRNSEKGRVILSGKEITNVSARAISDTGVAHVPEERIRFGSVPNLIVSENAILKQHNRKTFSRAILLNYENIREHAEKLVASFQVSTPSVRTPLKNLSGGNIQKLILGREISGEPSLLVASHPTYGLDVGATEYIRMELIKRRDDGKSVLLVSEDLEEILQLADRIAVIFRGRFMGMLDREKADLEEIGLMMAGVEPGRESGDDP
jgi:simple sugar transport system ATP-binding protein